MDSSKTKSMIAEVGLKGKSGLWIGKKPGRVKALAWASGLCVLLTACGGGDGSTAVSGGAGASNGGQINVAAMDTRVATGVLDLAPALQAAQVQQDQEVLGAQAVQSLAQVVAQPAFHVSALLPEPSNTDQINPNGSAQRSPLVVRVPDSLDGVDTAQLTPEALRSITMGRSVGLRTAKNVNPMAAGSPVSTYTPAQIRAAYGLPALPASMTGLTASQKAALGAGQTIYIVDAYHNPNIAAELSAFNTKFGLPACTTTAVAVNAALPLAAPPVDQCTLSVVYADGSSGMQATAPAYNSGWATETALDVQWAHATAPLARIVVIEAIDAGLNSLLSAIGVANKMGPGVVSLSLGAPEGSWGPGVDSYFSAPGMTYMAATGDNGTQVNWPAVSSKVIGVGGTSMVYTGTGARMETVWSGAGGGVSAFVPTPTYQASGVVGVGSVAKRAVSDVAFNADPATGQYTAIISPGSSTVNWISVGGTSLAAPQWAGLVAVSNALRAQKGVGALGAFHATLYQMGANATTYNANFMDITSGSNGACTLCTGKAGFDLGTGLGTPQANVMVSTLSGSSVAAVPVAPVVTAMNVSGTEGTPLTFTVSAKVGAGSTGTLSYSATNMPSGMVLNTTTGAVTWSNPPAGTSTVNFTVKDSSNGATASAAYGITIKAVPPTVTTASITGDAGKPLSFNVTASGKNKLNYTATGMPAGMSLNASTGAVAWAAPVAGSYTVTFAVADTVNKLTAQAPYAVKINAAAPVNSTGGLVGSTTGAVPAGTPTITGAMINGTTASAVNYQIMTAKAGSATSTLLYGATGMPVGMTLDTKAGILTWAKPVAGAYSIVVTVKDSVSLKTATATFNAVIASAVTPPQTTTSTGNTATVTQSGLTLTAADVMGTAGKSVTLTIALTNSSTDQFVGLGVAGIPMGLTFGPGTVNAQGITMTGTWPSAVKGVYTVALKATSAKGVVLSKNVIITIN